MLFSNPVSLALDHFRLAEPVQHHITAGLRKSHGNPGADPACGTGHDRSFATQGAKLPMFWTRAEFGYFAVHDVVSEPAFQIGISGTSFGTASVASVAATTS